MDLETEEISEMVVEGAGGLIHFNEHKQETRESSISAEETVFGIGCIADAGILDASNCIVNKESNDELNIGVFAGSNTNVDSGRNVWEVGNQEKETFNDEHEKEEQITVTVDMQNNGAGLVSEGVNEMFTVSDDNDREETVMGNLSNQDTGEEKDLESLTDAVALNEKEEIIDDDTNTAKEELLVPKKKVLKPKKVVKKVIKKRKLVKGGVLAKIEEEPQSSEMHVSSVEERTNENVKNEENPDANLMDNVNSSLTDAATLNEKVEIRNDDTITTKEAPLVPNNKALKTKKVVKKVVKKKKLVKRKVVAKDEEEPQSSEMHESSGEVRTNQNVENEENPEAEPMDNVKSSLTDAVPLNEKEEIINDDTNTTKEVLVPNNKVLKPKKVVKKVIKKVVKRRRLVKGIVVAKDDEKPQSSEIPDPSVDVRTDENVKNQENPDAKPMDNVNSSSTARTKNKNARQIADEVAVQSMQSGKGEQAGKGKAASKTENMDNMEEEAKSKSSKIGSRKAEKSSLIEVPAEHNDEAGPSEKHKSSNEVETTGMIFMCSSKTKEDCYRYKLFGLPASKKDVVLKIYKGMKLFLFDFKLKLLYGIYEAAEPGGYNIEPNAFHSNFPSQVRFTIVHQCSPLLEAKFKKVIKDNYYTKNKFKCELNSKQVTSLCELFRVDKKATLSKAKAVTDRPKVEIGIRPIVEREKKRKATTENEVNRVREKRKAVVDSERDIKRRRVVDDVKRSKTNRDVRPPRVNRDVRPPRVNRDVRPPRVNLDVRRPRAEDNRRSRLEDNARRLRAKDDSRRLRLEADARRLRLDDDARRSRLEDDARRLRAESDARCLRAENDARRLRVENDARRILDEDRRRILDEDRRRILDEDRRHSRLADVYEREAYLPSSALPAPLHLDALPPPAVPSYTLSYDYGRASNLSEDRALSYSGSRLLSEYERSRDPYLPYREPVEYHDQEYALSNRRAYSPIAPRGEYPPSTSRISGYRVSPYRRY